MRERACENVVYENRKEQMRDFAKEYRHGKITLSQLLMNACMCGAAEERYRSLGIIRRAGITPEQIAQEILSVSVLKVIGYDDGGSSNIQLLTRNDANDAAAAWNRS